MIWWQSTQHKWSNTIFFYVSLFDLTDSLNIDYRLASDTDNAMFQHEDPLFATWSLSPPPSVKSPSEFTYDDSMHIDQPYPSPADSESFDERTSEQTYDFSSPLAQPMPSSQDYDESHTLADEVFQIVCSTDDGLPMPIAEIKREYEPEEKDNVWRHDMLLCQTSTSYPIMTNYSDSQDYTLSVRPEDVENTILQKIITDFEEQVEIMETNAAMSYENNNTQKQIAVEHTYNKTLDGNAINVINTEETAEVSQPEKLSHRRRFPQLKLQINASANDNANRCDTADIISDTLDMENENFDIIKFLDSPPVRHFLEYIY